MNTGYEIVFKDGNNGLGVIAKRFFRSGELIRKMQGEIVSDIRQHTLQIEPGKHILDLEFSGYLLHSCDPNVSLDMEKLEVTAIKDIHCGAFLTMDYAQTEDYLYKQFACQCNAKNCRGWIQGKKDACAVAVA